MRSLNILFLHGWKSVPSGVKPSYLAAAGHQLINPKLSDDDFELAVAVAQAEVDARQPDVIVGSSRGGAVAINLVAPRTPLVLLCPAWKRWGKADRVKRGTVILHSPLDDVIAVAESRELLSNSDLPHEALIYTGIDHRLADAESLRKMLEAVEEAESIARSET